jgi:hypothetical protein
MSEARRFQFGLINALQTTAWISVFFATLSALGMAWRGEAMWNWPDALAVPVIALLLLLVVGSPLMAAAILFSKARIGIVVSLFFASLYVVFNWLFANW